MIVLFLRSVKPEYFLAIKRGLSDSTPLKKIDYQDDEATTRRRWIRFPAIPMPRPNAHITTRMTRMVHNIRTLP